MNKYFIGIGMLSVIASVVAALAPGKIVFGDSMKQRSVNEDSFSIIGIEGRTNNALEMTKDGIIPKMWARFYTENVLSKIPAKSDQSILAFYTDYQSDKTGDYTFVIGAKVKSTDQIPDGMIAKVIPSARYEVFTTDKGPVGSVVIQAWQLIWGLEDRGQLEGRRAYKADFEVYDQRAQDPQSSQVDIYIGLK